MEFPNITIDDINFRLIGYNPANDIIDRPAIKIISTTLQGDTFELYLYQSETSLGFWRLGCNNRGMLYKGDNDYVQQTFIHFTLQQFINENISRIKDIRFTNEHPEANETLKNYILTDYPKIWTSNFPLCYTKISKYKCTLDHYIYKIINEPTRMINLPTFSDLDKIVENRCGFWKKNPQETLNTISENFQRDYILSKDSIRFLYNDIYQYENINYDGTPKKLNVIYNIFICNLVSKNKDYPNLFLYYTIYKIMTTDKIEKDSIMIDNYYFPLFLTTNTKITPFGIYPDYVLSAGYICKLFEYIVQSANSGVNISKEHVFIGIMYNDLFPFNEIKLI